MTTQLLTYRGQDRTGCSRLGSLTLEQLEAGWVERRWRAGWRRLTITTSAGDEVGSIETIDHRRVWWSTFRGGPYAS